MINSQTSKAPMGMVVTLTACVGTIGANSLALGPIAPAIAGDLDAPVTQVMWAASGYGLGTAVGALFLGRYIDRIGTARALFLSLAFLALAFWASALVSGAMALTLAQTIAGLAAGIALPAIYAFAAEIAPPGRESTILGRVLIGWTLSLVAGVSLSAVVADLAHWRGVYLILGASTTLTCLPVWLAGRRRTTAPAQGIAPSPLQALTLPGVLPLLLICFGYMAAFYSTYGYIGDHISTILEMPVRASALIALSYGIGFGAASWGDPLIDRLGARRVMPPAFLFIGLIYGALAFSAPSYIGLVVLSAAWGLGNHFGLNLIVAGLSAIDPARRGTILGLYSGTTYIAASLGVLVLGPFYVSQGFAALCLVATGLLVAAALVAFSLTRRSAATA